MKKIILLLSILVSHVAISQPCPPTPVQQLRGDSLVARKIKLCGATPGLYKFNSNFHFVPAVAGSDYSTPSSLSDSLDGYLKRSGGIMTGAIAAGGQPSVDPVGRFLYYSTGASSVDYGEGALFSLDGLSSAAFYDGTAGFGLTYGGSSVAFIKTSNVSGGNKTFQFPNISGDLLTQNSTATLTNKTWNGVVIGSSYGGAGTVSGILKANGSGTVSAAVAGTDYPDASLTSGEVAYANGTKSITSEAAFAYSESTNTLTVGKPYITDRIVYPSTSSGAYSYNTSDTTTNYERVRTYWNSNVYTIESQAGGSGTARMIRLIGGSRNFTVGSFSVTGVFNGALTTSSSNVSTFGATGTWSNSSNVNNGYAFLGTINQSGTAGYRAWLISPYEQATGSGVKRLISAGTNSAADGGGTHTEKFYVDNAGNTVAAKYSLSALNTAPSSAGDTGTTGEIRIDADYIYICTATNTWKRVAISTW